MNPTSALLPLVLCLLGPATSWARFSQTALPADAPTEPASSWRVAASESTEVPGTQENTSHELSPRPGRGLRILSEVGVGLGGAVVGGLTGGLVGLLIPCTSSSGTIDLSCFALFANSVAVGIAMGLPLGVWLGGRLAGGQGSLLATLVGAGLGSLVLVGAVAARAESPLLIGLLPLPLLLSVVAYELTDSPPVAPARANPLRLHPMLGVTSGGGLVGLGGRF